MAVAGETVPFQNSHARGMEIYRPHLKNCLLWAELVCGEKLESVLNWHAATHSSGQGLL